MSNLIQTARLEAGVSNAELARRLGVTAGAVSQLERSERDGSIRWETLERALSALERRPVLSMTTASKEVAYDAEAITDSINRALDDGDETFALRILTRGAQRAKASPSANDLSTRSSRIKDPRWEALFAAVYGDALPAEQKPAWAHPARLSRRWYVSRFAPLRERAKTTTPARLRELNIFLDARSLERV